LRIETLNYCLETGEYGLSQHITNNKEEKMGDTTDLSGDWIINDGTSLHKLQLTQLGNQVSGVYDWQQGTIEGLVEGNVLKLRWDHRETNEAVRH
jgi:hypothetical protein